MSKHLAAVLAALILALVLSGCSPNPAPPEKGPIQGESQAEQGKTPGTQISQVKTVGVTVTKVVDGDTIHVSIKGKDESVRLIGANSPELSHPQQKIKEQPYGKQALEYTKNALLNKQVYLEFDVGERDRYGRVLAYVWLEEPKDSLEKEVRAKMFNARLLLEGYAQVMTVSPNVKYADVFKKFGSEAREAKKGFWLGDGEKPNDRYNK